MLRLGRHKARGARRRPATAELVLDRGQDPAEAGHLIHGKPCTDIEWATWRALRSLGWDEDRVLYQVSVFGGRSLVGGGQILDFVVDTGAGAVVVDVRGARWHGPQSGKAARDRWREMQLLSMLAAPRLVVVFEDVAHDWARLRALLLREVGAR